MDEGNTNLTKDLVIDKTCKLLTELFTPSPPSWGKGYDGGDLSPTFNPPPSRGRIAIG